jgi:hypothetical protein
MSEKKELNETDELWSDGAFMETLGPKDAKEKMKTFHMKHDEDVNYDCVKCNKKISAHNRDWHNHMCDDCFNKEYFPED